MSYEIQESSKHVHVHFSTQQKLGIVGIVTVLALGVLCIGATAIAFSPGLTHVSLFNSLHKLTIAVKASLAAASFITTASGILGIYFLHRAKKRIRLLFEEYINSHEYSTEDKSGLGKIKWQQNPHKTLYAIQSLNASRFDLFHTESEADRFAQAHTPKSEKIQIEPNASIIKRLSALFIKPSPPEYMDESLPLGEK